MSGRNSGRAFLVCMVLFLLLAVPYGPIWDAQIESDSIDIITTNEIDLSTSVIDVTQSIDFGDIDSHYFTENLGQWEEHIKFSAKTDFGYVGLSNDGVYYYVAQEESVNVVKIIFKNADLINPRGEEDMGFYNNYFLGNDKEKWVRESRSYERVRYKNIWPKIDILYYFKHGSLKYDIIVGDYAEPELISFQVEGQSSLKIQENGVSIIVSEDVFIKDSDLVAFYRDGSAESVTFKKIGYNTFGFQVDKIYGKQLTIDPIVFSNSTFLGGSKSDQARDMKFDSKGNIIILADTMSLDFPNTTGAYQPNHTGSIDIVITKMDHNASYLIFSTFIGGWSCDFPYALDVDSNDNIYATGETWARDFPTTNGTFMEEPPEGSSQDVFVLKLSSSGSDLIYSTYVGSSSTDWGRDIEIFNGLAYVVGYTYSYDFPFVDYPVNNAHGTVFFFILNQDASNLTHTAFWGGFQNEMAYSLEIDSNGDAVVGGITNSMDFPITEGAYQENATDYNNGFLLRYDPTTSNLIFSTYIGGSALDEIRSVYLDENGDVYFSGITNNPDTSGQIPFPTTPGAYDRTYNGSKDAFIAKMSSDGTNLIYSTLYGGEGEEMVGSIDVDSQGNIYFIGNLNSDVNFTVNSDAFDYIYNQGDDVVFAVLNADCSDVLYSTYLGGNTSDLGEACLLSGTDEIFLFGTTTSMDFPSTNGSYQTENDGSGVLFITKFVVGDFLYLQEGWNLISLPLVPSDTMLDTVLSSISGHYDAVQWFDTISGSWKKTHINKPSILNTLYNIDITLGFWIHITRTGGVLFGYTGTSIPIPQPVPLYKGWNAVGYPASHNMKRDAALNTLAFDKDVNSIWYHDALNGTWFELDSSDYFTLGRGYYIHAIRDCVWEVP